MYKISPNIIIEVSRDGLEGYITIVGKPQDYSEEFTEGIYSDGEIEGIIEEVKKVIKIGLDEDTLKRALYERYYNTKILIAEGFKPVNGKDGYIKYFFDLGKKIAPKVLEDGTVNYRELNIINNVSKGDVLAELVPPKEGKDGLKVTGETISYKKGKSPVLRYGKNVRLLDNGVTLVATKDGHVEIKGGKIVVSDVYEVENVDNTVGNIYFNGSVFVKGNVYNGFQIKADGDVVINGLIEGAYVENGGDVVVKRGIQGLNKLTIKTAGRVTTRFIENAIINSKMTITAEAIMHSQVFTKEDITLIGKRGLIVGGVCRAGKNIHAKTIGSSMATKTILEVGTDPELKDKSEKLKNEIEQLEENLGKIMKSLELMNKLKNIRSLSNDQAEMYSKLIMTKETLEEDLNKLKDEYEFIRVQIESISRGKIKVADTVYPGVKIVIGNGTMTVRDELKRCTFYNEGGEIRIGPYWE